MEALVIFSISLLAFFVAMIFVFLGISHRSDYCKTDTFGRKHRRPYFRPGRICPECGFRAITQIPTCPSCKTKFIKDSVNYSVLPFC